MQFRIRRARAGSEKLVVEHGFQAAAQPLEIGDLAVVHERPVAMHEGMAIVPPRAAAGRCADMGEKERRADLPREALQVAIRPGRQDVAVTAGLRPLSIPGNSEAIAIGLRLGARGAVGLFYEGMGRRRNQLLQIEGISAIGCPATHDSSTPVPAPLEGNHVEIVDDY